MKKNILMITSTSMIGGGPKQLMMLAYGLQDYYNVNVACPANGEINKEFARVTSGKIININERKFSFLDIFRLILFIKKFSINIIHTHGKGASVLGRFTSLFTGVPLIHTFHGIHIKKTPKLSRFIYIFYEKLTSFVDFFDVFVSNTEFLEASSYGLIKNNQYVIIPNGVPKRDITVYSIKNRDILRKELQIPINKNTIITLCRLEKIKNLFEFIDIAALCPNYSFIIVGGGDLAYDLKKYISNLNLKNVILTGFSANPFNYLFASDIFLSTSFREGHPISILEAMSIALPVIATDVTGNKDTIVHKKSGFFYQLGSINQAANYIDMLVEDPFLRLRIGKEGFAQQNKLFSSEAMVSRYLKIYSQI